MNAATVKRRRPMAHASCDGLRFRAYCIATATANAPDTKMVMSGSTLRRLAPAHDERRGGDTQNYGTRERHAGRVGTADRPRERGRGDRVTRAGRGECGERIAAQGERGPARDNKERGHRGERGSDSRGVDARTAAGRENQH